jgi:hypothetical protein
MADGRQERSLGSALRVCDICVELATYRGADKIIGHGDIVAVRKGREGVADANLVAFTQGAKLQ